MGEIKFRVIEARTGTLIGYERLWSDGTDSAWQRSHDGQEWLSDTFLLDDDFALRVQYTDAKDRTGEEVYQDDIIEYQAQEDGRWISVRVLVIWDSECLSWYTNDKYQLSLGTTLTMRGARVIGNRWENPELLEVLV